MIKEEKNTNGVRENIDEQSSSTNCHPTLLNIVDLLLTTNTPPKLFTISCNPFHSTMRNLKVPVNYISASGLNPLILQQHLRSSVKIRMKEIKNIYEGEVTELLTNNDSEIIITLKTLKGSKRLRLSRSLLGIIDKERISTGDIIYIECGSGLIKRLGRSESFAQDCDIESEKYIPLPKVDVFRMREIVQEMSLNDLDTANTKPNGGEAGLLLNMLNVEVKEINDDLMADVDRIIKRYVENGNCEINEEILIIEDGECLSIDCIRFLKFTMERKYCPFVFVIFNEKNEIESKLYESFVPIKLPFVPELEVKGLLETQFLPGVRQSCSELDNVLLMIGEKHGMTYVLKAIKLLKEMNEINKEVINEIVEMLGIN